MKKVRGKKRASSSSDDDAADNDGEGEQESSSRVMQVGTRIFFYADVNVASVHKLYRCMRSANASALESEAQEISIHINSSGGDAYAGLAAYHHILRNPVSVTTYVDGFVASAATFLLLAGRRRVAMKHGFVLIHQVSTGFVGKYNDLIDEMANTHDLMDSFRTLYTERTSMTLGHLDDLLRSERVIHAQACLDHGIVHVIESGIPSGSSQPACTAETASGAQPACPGSGAEGTRSSEPH